MKINSRLLIGLFILIFVLSGYAKIKVVTTFSDYASIVREIGGDRVEVQYLSSGDQDPHFVPPKPSLAMKLKDADMLVTTGLDLEAWVTVLQEKSRNKNIMDGAIGFVTASSGLELLEKPGTALSRSEGDVHVYGNPHIQTSPLNWKTISQNILIGLKKVDPDNASFYETNQEAFIDRVDRSMFGNDLVNLFGGEKLSELLIAGSLFDFLQNTYEGEPLQNKLGGWLREALPFRNQELVAYHQNWVYFARDFGLNIAGYIEPKPGIPPTPKHVETMIQMIQDRHIKVMLVASHFERRQPTTIAQRTGIHALFLPLSVGAVPGTEDNFKLVDLWIQKINEAIAE